ncbi:MAG: hypothetical protein M3397_02025 [Actinomycetota bacterium]|jgi:hypothetical protein|nr:hypothetical protein [Actinomycetota bacterium]MDQ3566845.1 hypothetical protein [Actinomycetota bacterium]
MPADKDKGLLGLAQDGLKGTTGSLTGEGTWHSVNAVVYHDNPSCITGGNIEPENVRQGTGDKQLCGECQRLNTAGGPVGNLTNL